MSPEEFARHAPIHPDSLKDYERWEALLRQWNRSINLVAPKSLSNFWERHALDSAQILPHIPDSAEVVSDFGSGAGFPGLAIAIDAKHRSRNLTVHLIESAGKKASFLKTVSRETLLKTQIHSERIEAVDSLQADVITARAFAPLSRLLPMASRHLKPSGRLVLLKGESLNDEIATVQDGWSFSVEQHESLSSETGVIVVIEDLKAKNVSRETVST